MVKVVARDTIGCTLLIAHTGESLYPDTSMDVVAEMHISDEAAAGIARTLLERLAGQGKITEELRQVCYCLGQREKV